MLETGLRYLLSIWSVLSMIVGVIGSAWISYLWASADVFGKPIEMNGRIGAIDGRSRGSLALGIVVFSCFAATGAWLCSNTWVAGTLVSFFTLVPIWVFPLLALLLWLGVTSYLNNTAGWPSLQRFFQRPLGEALAKQRLKWAVMANGVAYRNVLSISAYRDGVGIEMNRWFGLFTRPVLVPWEQVSSIAFEEADTKFVRLKFAEFERITVVLAEECWRTIECYRPKG